MRSSERDVTGRSNEVSNINNKAPIFSFTFPRHFGEMLNVYIEDVKLSIYLVNKINSLLIIRDLVNNEV